jgi:hypothetical protein
MKGFIYLTSIIPKYLKENNMKEFYISLYYRLYILFNLDDRDTEAISEYVGNLIRYIIDIDFELAYNTYLAMKSKINITSSIYEIFVNYLIKNKIILKIKDINLLDGICKLLENKITVLIEDSLVMKRFLKLDLAKEKLTNKQKKDDYDAILDLIDNIYRDYRNYDKIAKIYYNIYNSIDKLVKSYYDISNSINKLNPSLSKDELINVYEKQYKYLYSVTVFYTLAEKDNFINLTYNNIIASELNKKQIVNKYQIIRARLDYLQKYDKINKIETDEGFMNLIFSQKLYNMILKHCFVVNLEKEVAYKLLQNITLLLIKGKIDIRFFNKICAQIEHSLECDLAVHLIEFLANYESAYIPFDLVNYFKLGSSSRSN